MKYISDHDDAFGWVDDYMSHIRSHFEVREADNLLIVLPNRAVKLNSMGVKILRFLKDGGRIDEVLKPLALNNESRYEAYCFLCDFRSLISGCLGEGLNRKAVSVEEHGAQFNVLPILSEIAVTYRCNLKCRFCYAACGCHQGSTVNEMTENDVLRVIKIIREQAGVPSVSFTGGEPLMRPELERFVAAAVQTGLRVNLITNGTLLAGNDRADRLKQAGLSSAQVSLEGASAEIHDRLTGVAGSFEKTLIGLKALRDAGIHVHTNTTISKLNAENLVEIVGLVAELGLSRISMNMIIPTGSAADMDLQVEYSDIWSMIEPARAAARMSDVEFMWYSPTPMCIFNPLATGFGNKSCAACDGLLSISPSGDVLPCSSYAEPVGNLLSESFEKVWESAGARYFRNKEYAPSECSGCVDFVACAGACPLYWSAMGTGELASVSGGEYAVS